MSLMEDFANAPGAMLNAGGTLRALLANASVEATPRQIQASARLEAPEWAGLPVYVPMLPGAAFLDSLESCRRLKALGLIPVPHLAARSISGPAELDDVLPRFVEAGVEAMLLIAGDQPTPVGPYDSTLALLDSGELAHNGVRKLGVAGHPEGHPAVDRQALQDAMRTKAGYARATGTEIWVVTQFMFDAAPLPEWESALEADGVDLPVWVGLPGPSSLRALMGYALRCGVGASAKALARRPDTMKMLGRWRPDGLAHEVADAVAASKNSRIKGLHIYPFGGLDASLDWIAGMRAAARALG